MLKKEIAQVEHWFHTEAERFMLRHQGLGKIGRASCRERVFR